jgi:hypothetical protein
VGGQDAALLRGMSPHPVTIPCSIGGTLTAPVGHHPPARSAVPRRTVLQQHDIRDSRQSSGNRLGRRLLRRLAGRLQ